MNPKPRSQLRILLRGVGYPGAGSLLLVVAAVWIGDSSAVAVSALALTILAPITVRRGARLGSRPDRPIRHTRESTIRSGLATASVQLVAGRRPIREESTLPTWMRAEPRAWHFAPLALLALWTLLVLFRVS